MVGGLVEQEGGGAPHQQGGEGEASPLPAGEGDEAPSVVQPVEAEPGEDGGRAAVRLPDLLPLGALQLPPVGGEQAGVLRCVLRCGLQQAGEPVEFGERGAGLAQCAVHHGGEGRRRVVRQLLMQEAEVGGADDVAGVGLVGAGEQAQQGRLADAVLADEADAPAGGGGETDAVEDAAAAEDADEVVGEEGGFWHGFGSPPA